MSIQRYNVDGIVNQLRSCAYDMNDPHYDGFVQWGRKQDLYRVKFILDKLLESSPKFAPEDEWLAELEKERAWELLKQGNK